MIKRHQRAGASMEEDRGGCPPRRELIRVRRPGSGLLAVLLWSCLVLPGVTLAAREPLWEIGVGGGALRLPDYRGADETGSYVYPFLIPFYRGQVIQADERGIRGLFFESDRIKLDISLDGSVPVSSSDNAARKGMPDLHPSFQVGPKFRYLLWDTGANFDQTLSFELPLRAAFAIDAGIRHIGYTSHPNLTYRQDLRLLDNTWRLRLSGGPMWGSETYHDYFYRIPWQYVRPDRVAYDADAGYAGMRAIGTLYRRDRHKLISFYALYDSVRGAVFDDSPLVRQDSGLTLGFLVTWFLFKSDQTVETQGRDW